MRYKYLILLVLTCSIQLLFAQGNKAILVPLGGNAFANIIKRDAVTKDGIAHWDDKNISFKIYVRLAKTGSLSVALKEVSKVVGENLLSINVNQEVKAIHLKEGQDFSTIIGEWQIRDTGYVAIEIKGINKTAALFPNIKALSLSGSAINELTSYVKNDEGNLFYWGRRGPSVHLNYQLPENVEAEWFYNELTVPQGEDIVGSYFMANGFGEGYFGIQVNSATERRVLFSVWSPFTTDDPRSIPESHQVTMLQKGKDVYTGEFGNEGSGGQSYLKYDWKTGQTYKFLLHVNPTTAVPKANSASGTVDLVFEKDSTTTYTAYFFAPELKKWKLIASFKRPKTQTYLKRPHSFLENFIPEMGDKERKVLFSNQWVRDTKGQWIELNTARFTIDHTGNINFRKDYGGGVIDGSFYLRNCGFFADFTSPKTIFSRSKINKEPVISFFNGRYPQE